MDARDKLDEDTDVNMQLKKDEKEEENKSMIAKSHGQSVFYKRRPN